ncbi:unnamed protein product [Closterium sp. Naga37s-1]|nr:unnamed protein product [Closterium sp. Naga37s-1]
MRVGPRIASSVSVWKGEAELLEAVSRWRSSPGELQFSFLVGEYPEECRWRSAGLSVDPESFAKTTALEVIHARWAMLAVVACLVPETAFRILQASHLAGGSNIDSIRTSILGSTTSLIESCDFCTAKTILAIGAIQILGMAAVEAFRVAGGPLGDASGSVYPGGFFDPLGLADSSNPTELAKLKAKELQNGRLAMFSILGFAAQAAVTGKGPVENLMEHMADPKVHNAWTYAEGLFH